jgi:hypothetical protein
MLQHLAIKENRWHGYDFRFHAGVRHRFSTAALSEPSEDVEDSATILHVQPLKHLLLQL